MDKRNGKWNVLFRIDGILTNMGIYKTEKEVAVKVFQKPLSYLTKEHLQELEDLRNQILELENDDKDIFEFLLEKYKALKKDVDKVIKGKFLETKFI